ncbi:MAG TPA: hypothetical protein VG733_14915 [Chthoniobacteraceae bacterium]|nr:hypothetical protein [Chthoniobacteraceae bacterium]
MLVKAIGNQHALVFVDGQAQKAKLSQFIPPDGQQFEEFVLADGHVARGETEIMAGHMFPPDFVPAFVLPAIECLDLFGFQGSGRFHEFEAGLFWLTIKRNETIKGWK